jgi:hypothetical protein
MDQAGAQDSQSPMVAKYGGDDQKILCPVTDTSELYDSCTPPFGQSKVEAEVTPGRLAEVIWAPGLWFIGALLPHFRADEPVSGGNLCRESTMSRLDTRS